MSLRLLVGCLLLAMIGFAGCGQDKAPEGDPNPTSTPPSSQSTPAPADTQVAGDPATRPADQSDPSVPTDDSKPGSDSKGHPPSTNGETPASPDVPLGNDTLPFSGSGVTQPKTMAGKEPAEGPGFPSPDKISPVENDPPIQQREERKPMAPPPEAEGLVRITPDHDVWLDGKNKRIVLGAKVVLQRGPLELFCTLAEQKEHEAVLSVLTEAYFVHAALVSFGFDPGRPVQFRPEYQPAQGPEIEITVHWTDENGKRQSARGQDWVRNTETGKALEYPWVFGGSSLWQDQDTGQSHYLAEGGDFICVSNFPSAMIDLPIRSTDTNAALLFEAFTERIPPRGTEVAIVLTPKPWKRPAANEAADDGPVEAPAPEEVGNATGADHPAPVTANPADDGPVEAPPAQ